MLFLLFRAVLSASDAQVRAHSLRKRLKEETRMSDQQRLLMRSLWLLQKEFRCLESLPIQPMVHYLKDLLLSSKSYIFPNQFL